MSEEPERGLVCVHCGKSWGYKGQTPSIELMQEAINHESSCIANPQVVYIKKLERDNEHLKKHILNITSEWKEAVQNLNATLSKFLDPV